MFVITRPRHPACYRAARVGLAVLATAALGDRFVPPAQAQTQARSNVYSCVTAQGRRLTSDRPIAECNDREQRLLGRDGTVLRVVPPSLTAEERTAREAVEQRAAAERAAQAEAMRMDRNLVRRYPNEAAHNKARASALGDVQTALAGSKKRLDALAEERQPLEREAEFYVGKPLPVPLKRQIDANDAARQAVLESQANNTAEQERVAANYDKELERLRKLWAGAEPGKLGALVLADKPAPAPAQKKAAPAKPAKPATGTPSRSAPTSAATVKR